MASSGKKNKKNKGTVISLQSFLANGDAPAGTTQVSKKIRNVDGDDSDDGSNAINMVVQLPTAPRATRIFDDDSIPHKPPFIAYVTNLPFDADEDDIHDFFGSIPILSLRLPREDGETGRVRGFGYVEFDTREDLIDVLSLPDPSIKGRRIRIELSNEQEQQSNRPRGSRRGYDGFGNSNENRESTNWRRDAQENNNNNSNGNDHRNNYDRGFNRDRKPLHDDSGASAGSWRTGNRNFEVRDRDDRDRVRDRDDRDRVRDREREPKLDAAQERPKLNLKPRTLPLPETMPLKPEPELLKSDESTKSEEPPKPVGVPSEKVFGSAKPVDTAARELEFEHRLEEARRQDQLRRENDEIDVSKQVSEIHLEKTEKDKENSAISWRRRTDDTKDNRNDNRKYSPDRRHDNRKPDNRERDFNRLNKNRDRNARSDEQGTIDFQPSKDVKAQDDSKTKRDIKTERPLSKFQPQNEIGPVLQSSNKYSGLDDEASD